MKRSAFTLCSLLLTLFCFSQGTNMSNPIVMGTYAAGTYTYTDSRNNSSYGNDYGQASADIFYKFTVEGTTQISISTCGSGWDTYLHLLTSSGSSLIYNDDNGTSCSGLTASIVIPSGQTTITSLAAGTYYIVAEGYSSYTGTISLAVNLTVQSSTPPVYDTRNFIRTWDATAPETNGNTLMTKALRDVKQTTAYFDGLGRPDQTVVKKGSLISATGAVADIVSPMVYDEFGREVQKYLPYVATTDDGLFKTSALTDQNSFYTGANSPVYGQGESYFYSKTNYEASPLNRVEKVMAPGINWTGSSRGVENKYWTNTTTDAVRIWTVANDLLPAFGTYATTATYPAGELYKSVTVDEQNNQVIEFKDKEGKVILKKVQLTATADDGTGKNHDGWLCTYYIYDDLGQLRCVIQPEGVKALSNTATFNWSLSYSSGILLNEQCFRYEYDGRNRMVMKKVPGANEVYMVYDARDRLVMTQDANLRAINKWIVTLYDELNRPVQTGLLLNTWNNKTFVQHLAAYSSTTYPFVVSAPPSATYWEYLTKTGYDEYSTIPAASSLTSSIDNTYINSTYGFFTTYNTSPDYAQQIPAAASVYTKGMVTWTETKVLETSSYLYTVNLYDEKGRLVQVKSKNYTGTVDVLTTQYNWSGQPLVSVYKQEKGGTGAQTSVIVTRSYYDDLGRLTQTDKKVQNTNVNGNVLPANYTTISKNEYDALGQLKKKKLAPAYNNNAGLETLTYDYNIRGWMLGANRDYAKDANNTNYFGFDLGYDKANNGLINNQAYTAPQYNGNITGMVWKSKGDGEKRKYDFTYDAVNRLTGADFNQYTGSAFNKTANVDFSVSSLSYDANGNIITMNQKGLKLNASPTIDQLSYTYQVNSNKLAKVADAIAGDNKLGDFKDGANGTTDDYNYDVNGNMTVDKNKKIDWIDYNFLNLPRGITIRDNSDVTNTIVYKYDAAGNKLQKEVYPGAVPPGKITLYLGASVFRDNVLQFISSEEGRIRFIPANGSAPAGFAYDYFLKDHLGNVRMVLTEEQQTIYYPAATVEGTYSPTGTTQDNSMINWEKQFYNIDNTKVINETSIASWPTETVANTKLYYNHNNIPPASPNPNYPAGVSPVQTAGSTKLYKLNATTNRTGLEFIIKVMAGDKIDIFGKSYFLNTGTVNNANSTALDLSALMINLLTAPVNAIAAKGITSTQLNTWNTGLVPSSFFRGTNGETTTIPKAYINYIFLDEQFKYAGGGASRVGDGTSGSGVVKDHWNMDAQLQNIPVPKNGYIFVYVSNESNLDVFFDNLQVVHKPGPIVEETHYYPFGLTMSGISSKALNNSPENKYKFNDGTELASKEFSDGSGLEMYETPFRGYDPQIGRFWQIDEMADDYESWSPYTFSLNNPIFFNDPSGLEPEDPDKPVVTPASFLPEVIVKSTPKNNYNYLNWITFVELNKHHDRGTINNILINQGVNDRGLKLFNQAWNGIGYRERLAEIEAGWREGVQDALLEGVTWVAGGPVLKIGGKAISWGYRASKLYRASKFGKKGITVIGEGMKRVEVAASKIPGAKTLNDMPVFTGTAEQITSQMMQHNRKWILNEMRSGKTILDIGRDLNRANPSIFYQMEQNMLKNYQKLHPGSLNIISR